MGRPAATIENITPKLASKWLSKNISHNRKIKPSRVEQYADDILSDRWEVGAPFLFNGDGSLLDGQHRLAAIVKADKSVQGLVVRGLPKNVANVIDTGAKRSLADTLVLNGYKHNISQLSACIAWCLRYEVGTLANRRGFNHGVALEWLQQHDRKFAQYVKSAIAIHSSNGYALRIHVPAMVGVMLYSRSPRKAEEFFARVASGINLESGSPELALRKWYERDAARTGIRATPLVRAAVTIKAWNQFVLGNSISRLNFASDREAFPKIIRS